MTPVENVAGTVPAKTTRIARRTKALAAAAAVIIGIPAVLLGYGEYLAVIGTLVGAAGGISVTVVNIRR